MQEPFGIFFKKLIFISEEWKIQATKIGQPKKTKIKQNAPLKKEKEKKKKNKNKKLVEKWEREKKTINK